MSLKSRSSSRASFLKNTPPMTKKSTFDESNDTYVDTDEEEELENDVRTYFASKTKHERSESRNDIDGLDKKLEEIRLVDENKKPFNWLETLAMMTEKALEVEDIEDDLKRETAIYTGTLEAVERALNKLKQEKQKYQRPDDYYAEMVKSDEHMLKLKDHLLAEKRRKEEWSKKLRELQLRKFAKKAQVSVSIKRQKQKAENLEIVRQWRLKQRNTVGTKMPFPKELLDVNNPVRKAMLESAPKSNLAPLKSKKRLLKDQQYGYGGSKKFKRLNNQVKEDEDKYLSFIKRRRESKNTFFKSKAKNQQPASAKKPLKKRPGKQHRQKLK